MQRCDEAMVCIKLTRREYYFSITLDRNTNGPIIIGSSRGGVNIEEVVATEPEAIVKVLDSVKSEDVNGEVMDCKMLLDSTAEFRQPGLFALKDSKQENPLAVRAAASGFLYEHLGGEIGCITTGDLRSTRISFMNATGNIGAILYGVQVEQVTEAFEIIASDAKAVNAILVNIFGGIMRCDVIAQGIIKAAKELDLKIPIVVRLQGTESEIEDVKAKIAGSKCIILLFANIKKAALMV